jgi:thioredoxin-dependent peroxiredoxin
VAGLSRDSVKSHVNFAAKMELTYPLLSDPETGLLQALGAWGSKKVKGEVKFGPVRSTVVVDAKGKVLFAYFKVKAKGHAEAVLEDLT